MKIASKCPRYLIQFLVIYNENIFRPASVQTFDDLLLAKAPMLKEYFSIIFDAGPAYVLGSGADETEPTYGHGYLSALPDLLHGYMPPLIALPTFLLRLASEVSICRVRCALGSCDIFLNIGGLADGKTVFSLSRPRIGAVFHGAAPDVSVRSGLPARFSPAPAAAFARYERFQFLFSTAA